MLGRDVLISWFQNIPRSSQKTKDFRREIIWDFFAIFCQPSRYRARFQASSDHSDSANEPGYEADYIHQLCQVWAKSVIWALSPPAWFSHGHTLKSWFSNGYGYDQIPKQSQLVYLIHFDQLSMLIKSAENPSHFYHFSSFSNQACSACFTQNAR